LTDAIVVFGTVLNVDLKPCFREEELTNTFFSYIPFLLINQERHFMAIPSRDIDPALKDGLKAVLTEWANSLPPTQANSTVITVSGVRYSPIQILDEVQRSTEFGNEFLAGLSSLHDWMVQEDPESSVIDLIRNSIASTEGVQQDQYSIRNEIQSMVFEIYQTLGTKDELSLTELQREVHGSQPIFGWAIGWLASEMRVAITMTRGELRIRLVQPEEAMGATA
jgi:hypothetical protein